MRLFTRLTTLLRRRALDHDLSEELETHRQMTEQRLRDSGMTPADAAAASRRRMGNTTLAREDARAEWLAPWIESVWQDMRYGVRHLSSHPSFTLTAGLTLVLATALNTSFFTLFNATVLRPWPVADPSRTVMIHAQTLGSDGLTGFLRSDFQYLREHARSFTGLAAFSGGGARVGSVPGPDFTFVQAGFVSGGFFGALGVPMAMGRDFAAAEDDDGTPGQVVVIGDGLWQRAFGRDPQILGRTIYVNDAPMTVVGVTTPGTTGIWPFQNELWMPLAAAQRRHWVGLSIAGTLAQAASRDAARAEVAVLMRQLDEAAQRKLRMVLVTGTRQFEQPGSGPRVAPYVLVLGALLVVLLLGCANVGNLQLARAVARRRELAIRLSLGAARGRIVRQLLTETLLLAAAAGAIAIVVSSEVPAAVMRASGAAPAMVMSIRPDRTVLLFALLICAATTIVTGLAPALRGTRDAADFVSVQRGVMGVRRPVLRAVLLSTQIALSATLLFGATLLTRGLLHASASDPGYDLGAVTVAQVTLPPGAYDAARSAAFMSTLLDGLKSAGFTSVGRAYPLPLEPSALVISVRRPEDAPDDTRTVQLRPLSADAFQVLGIPVVAGRLYTDGPGRRDIVVNEKMARTMWPGGSAVGQRLIDRSVTWEVVGVVADVHMTGLGAIEPVIHFPRMLANVPPLLIRAQPEAVRPQLMAMVQGLEPRATVVVTPLTDIVRQSLMQTYRSVAISWGVGALALLLAATGVFGVFSYIVEERSREIGIRMALGARRSEVLALMFRTTRTSVLTGLALAAVLSIMTGFALRAFLFGLSPLDPLAYAGATIVLALAAVLATAIPVRRATRVDPVAVLRLD